MQTNVNDYKLEYANCKTEFVNMNCGDLRCGPAVLVGLAL